MAEEEKNKSEKATPFKLREAKRKGQVAKSMEFNSFMMLFLGMVFIGFFGQELISLFLQTERVVFSSAHTLSFDIQDIFHWFAQIFSNLLFAFSPFIVGIIVVAVLMNMMQTGPIFTFFPLKPDIQRLNPVKGFKRIFSMRMVYEAIKTVIKIAVFGFASYLVLKAVAFDVLKLPYIDYHRYPTYILNKALSLGVVLLSIMFLIAMADIIYTRREFGKKMMMSQREVKDEHKRHEGDPEIKQKIKQLQREASQKAQSLENIPNADVVITNPTHIVVAIKYNRDEGVAPELIAKGAGQLAQSMRDRARQHGIPIVENKELARKLFKKVGVDDYIPEKYFVQVAAILAWVYSREQSRVARSGAAS